MKKNMLSILILALLIVNVVLTAIMMFSVTGTAKRTSALIDDISAAINLDLENQNVASAGMVISTDHSREYVPFIAYGEKILPISLGTRKSFADIGATVCDLLSVDYRGDGESFANIILNRK